MLRAVPDKLWGFIAFAAAVALPFMLPWLDRSPVRSWRYRGNINKVMLVAFVSSFLILGVLGTQAVSPAKTLLAQIMTVVYFAYFFAMPWYTRKESTFPVPERVTGRWISIPQLLGSILLITLLVVLPLMLVSGSASVRELNRTMGWELPLSDAKTLNGAILEHLEAIPTPATSLLLGGYPVDIVQTRGNVGQVARIGARRKRGS